MLNRFGFDPLGGSIAIASSSLITVGLLAYMHKYAHVLSEKKVIVSTALSAAAGLLLSLADIGLWGYIVIFALHAGEHVLYPFMSEILNNHAANEQRATVLSVASFLRTLPYVILAPIIGYLSTNGKLEYFFITWAVLVGGAIVIYLSVKKRDSQVKIVQE